MDKRHTPDAALEKRALAAAQREVGASARGTTIVGCEHNHLPGASFNAGEEEEEEGREEEEGGGLTELLYMFLLRSKSRIVDVTLSTTCIMACSVFRVAHMLWSCCSITSCGACSTIEAQSVMLKRAPYIVDTHQAVNTVFARSEQLGQGSSKYYETGKNRAREEEGWAGHVLHSHDELPGHGHGAGPAHAVLHLGGHGALHGAGDVDWR